MGTERFKRTAATVRRISRSIGTKLFLVLFLVLLLSLGLLGFATVRLQKMHLEAAGLNAAARMSDVIRRSTNYYMLRNDRPALRHIVETVGSQEGIVRLRFYDSRGHVAFSTRASEVGTVMKLPLPQEQQTSITRINGERILGIVTPIANTPSCATAACHAHPATQRILGALDLDLSLAGADADIRRAKNEFVFYSAIIILVTVVTIGVLVYRLVHKPVHALKEGTVKIGRGELGVQIPIESHDELGALARSFNQTSAQLHDAREEITAWTATLEDRVRMATAELRAAQDQMIQAEKLASLGKLAAVVAHEINNPLSGILTYAKLLRKWIDRGDELSTHGMEMRDALQLIESESRRCGDIVRNLLTFARVAPMNVTEVDINRVVRQCIRLVEHKLELGNITQRLELGEELPAVQGDSGQVEQLLLALVMNAIEAMPREGTLRIVTEADQERTNVVITVQDDGVGIPPSLLPRLFDPFVTTKEDGKGVGLGLAICRSIVDRHRGKIAVHSEPGRGTTFTITLPAVTTTEIATKLEPALAGGTS